MKIRNHFFIDLPSYQDERGLLTFMEANKDIPFDLKRIYYFHHVPQYATRGGHAHKQIKQLIIPLSGSFDVLVDDGKEKVTYCLTDAQKGLYLGNLLWRELSNFSAGAICLVLASEKFDITDYISDYQSFLQMVS